MMPVFLWPLITAAFSFLVKVLSSRIGGLVVSALLFLGISFTSYTFGVAPLRTLIANELGGAGQFVNWVGFFGIDKFITIVLSSIAVKYSVQGAKLALTRKAV